MSTPDYTRTEALLRAALTAEVDTTMTLTDTPREYERLTGRIRRSRRRTQLLAAAAVVAVVAAGSGAALALRGGGSTDPGPAEPRPSAPANPRTTTVTPQALPAGALLGTVPGLPPGTRFIAPRGPDALAWGEASRELLVLDGETGQVVDRQPFDVPAGAAIRSVVAVVSDVSGLIVTFDLPDADPSESLLHVFVDDSFRERGRVTGGWTGTGPVVSFEVNSGVWIATGPAELARVDETGQPEERVTLSVTGAGFLAAAEGFWLTDFHANTTTLVDRTGKLVTTLNTPEAIGHALVGGRLVVFTGRGYAYVIDRTERRTIAVVRSDVGPVGSAFAGAGSVGYGHAGGQLFVIDPLDPTKSRTYTVRSSEFAGVAYLDGGRLWVLHSDGVLERYDPSKL